MAFNPSARSVVAAFDQVEAELTDFLGRVPLVPEHLRVWSPQLVRCNFDACSQLDSLWKLRNGAASNLKIADHFATHSSRVANEWLVVWEGDGFERQPFSAWSGQANYKPLGWWQAYNNLKHNRWENVRDATLENAVDASAALFLAVANDPECHPILAERKWLHTRFATDWIIKNLSSPQGAIGVTIESSLFSYAVGCSHSDFDKMLAHFNGCTRRFGKWLEAKFGRDFWIG
jgi:hypothetical protein